MKKLFITLLLFILVLLVNAQDSLTFAQFKYDFMSIEIEQAKLEPYDVPMYGSALVLTTTFIINQIIVSNHPNNLLTGSIFIVGGALSLYVFYKKSKSLEKQIQ